MDIYDGFNAYKMYLAMRLHFTTDYDYLKYNGQTKASKDSFLKRSDKFFFKKLEKTFKKQEMLYFFVANFIDHDDIWVGNLVSNASEQVYTDWKKRIQSLSYNFRNDCEYLADYEFDSLFAVSEYSHPLLLRKYLQKEISPETMIIIDSVIPYIKVWTKKIDEDIIWPTVRNKLLKYKPFVSVDKDKYKSIMREVFVN